MHARKILVTGGAGYIGLHTVVELIDAGYEPILLDNFSNSHPRMIQRAEEILKRPLQVYKSDCSNPKSVEKVFQREGEFHAIIHFAALKAVGESMEQPLRYYRNNVDSLLTLLESARRHQTPHFVFSSSCTVYGEPDRIPVTESTPQKDAESPYGDTKKIAERILEALVASQAPIKIVSLRYFNPIGAHPSALIGELPLGVPKNLVPFVTQTAAGIRQELVVYGDDYDTPDGTCIRDYLHVVDLARAHVSALGFLDRAKAASLYDVFNVGTGRGHSVLEIIHTFERTTGVKLNYRLGPRRPGDIEKIYANTDKSRKLLKWRPKFTLKDSLKHAWAWQQELGISRK